ncbi:hypothetical protein FA95DRAFT_908840 [Auriscalpium vulgare]|uniref:Uncharacterized protein n=1 Tax=Auriscalpium vulgare TaxID=40419 RepID=A0ACB8RYC8_9AGAM|nr:hypothetical protein FA95DRAFT_908840 [Auriscalpium vulgare]
MAFSISQPHVYLTALYCETLLHGMYTILFGTTIYLLVMQRPRTPVNMWFTGMTVVMYSLATAHAALCLHQALSKLAFSDEGKLHIVVVPSSSPEYTKLALEVINCFLGDTIMLWRAWTLWRKNVPVCLTPAILFLGSIATGIGMVYECAKTSSEADYQSDTCGRWAISWTAMTLATNAAATGIITYNSWVYHCDIRRILGPSASPLHRHVSLLLIESGSLYCCTFALLLALVATKQDGAYVLNHMIPQLTGIYPTLVLVLICLKLTRSDMNSRPPRFPTSSPRLRQMSASPDSNLSGVPLESRMEIAISREIQFMSDTKPIGLVHDDTCFAL